MAPAEYKLPNALLIILHLHLLDFPLQDATGYDERLFDPARGMRERNKAMEDISYFLVGKIERSRERAKSILPTYPCLQPSDTTAFRIALARYIEAIRNSIVHTSHVSEKSSELRGKQPASPAPDETPAWWWKDIVVRKSILDECCGERFERLILALSSHAVLKNSSRVTSTLQPLSAPKHAMSDTLSRTYAQLLATAQKERLEWERSAARLIQRQADLAVIRARLADPQHASSSRYDSLETTRLLSLRESRHQDLLRGSWRGDEGRRALQLISSLAGLLDPTSSSLGAVTLLGEETGAQSSSQVDHRVQVTLASETPPPLPIAAARHPSHLHALRAPLFPEESTRLSSTGEQQGAYEVPHAISERLRAIGQVHQSLREALAAAQGIHTRLQQRLKRTAEREAAGAPLEGSKRDRVELDTTLWAPRAGEGVKFKSPEDATFLLEKYGLETALGESAIEDRIAQIRTAVLPPFVAEPILEPEPEPEPCRPTSRLPQWSKAAPAQQQQSQKRPVAASLKHSSAQGPSKLVQPARKVVAAPPTAAAQGKEKARVVSRRMSRRASAARTRRSTMFGHREDADILRIVASVQDRSDSEDDSDEERTAEIGKGRTEPRATQPHTPARRKQQPQLLGTRGTLLSTVKKTAPRQSYDIDVHERAPHVPRLPSLRLSGAPELDEDEESAEVQDDRGAEDVEGEEMEEAVYEGNSMTLADILLHAGHQGNASMQLLGEEELEDEGSDWE